MVLQAHVTGRCQLVNHVAVAVSDCVQAAVVCVILLVLGVVAASVYFATGSSNSGEARSRPKASPACLSDLGYAATFAGRTETLACEADASRYRSRTCGMDGQWEPERNGCPACKSDGSGFMTTMPGATAEQACPAGLTHGAHKRKCSHGGVWEQAVNDCSLPPCPHDGAYPVTRAGDTVKLGCRRGKFGVRERKCSDEGLVWEDEINTCS